MPIEGRLSGYLMLNNLAGWLVFAPAANEGSCWLQMEEGATDHVTCFLSHHFTRNPQTLLLCSFPGQAQDCVNIHTNKIVYSLKQYANDAFGLI
jgi:hypothetical protein